MLQVLDVTFLCAHLLIISFNLLGWIWIRTRKLHLIVVSATLFSWLILGIKYGLGYCFLTDWHWEVKRKLGEAELPNSFITYFFDQYTNLNLPAGVVDTITIVSFASAILVAVYLNFIKNTNS